MDFALQRLKNQYIESDKFTEIEEVVKWMGAIQAQDYQQALWAIGKRMHSTTTIKDIESAIKERKILRTWPMRGTIHFVPAQDAKWMLHLSREKMLAKSRRRREQLELNEEVMTYCVNLFSNTLQGNNRYTRDQMMNLLESSGISTKSQRGYHILWYAAQIGLICHGPMQETQQTFVLLDEWVPNSKTFSRNEAIVELAKRYFTSHGPATIQDFAWWSGLTIKEAKIGIELIKPAIHSINVNKIEYWMNDTTQDSVEHYSNSVHLLPGFDEYLLGYTDRSAVLETKYASRIVPGKNGIFLPTLVINGQVVGTWKRKKKKNMVELKVDPFLEVESMKDKIMDEAKKYSRFIDMPLLSNTIEFIE